MSVHDDRRLWPGTVPPVADSPPLARGAVRRTTSVDLCRPSGFAGPLVITGAGRDCVGPDFDVLATASTRLEVDYVGGRTITAASANPEVEGVASLVGARAGSGFRRTLAEVCPSLVSSGSLVHLLLDEVTPGTLISGSSLAREGIVKLTVDGPGSSLPIDICAGWQEGGAMFDAIAETGVPLLGWGPPAPDLVGGDPRSWHEMDDLAPMSLRRRRRIDVSPLADGQVAVDVRYRDSYWEHDGTETVVHEYGLVATIATDGWVVSAMAATPGPLPAPECPSAAASVQRTVGVDVRTLREVVRRDFVGTSTCTHLNDVLRSMADVDVLWTSAQRPD